MMRVSSMTAEQLAAAWTAEHNQHLEDSDHPALAMLERYLALQGTTMESDLLALIDQERQERRHQLARRLRSTRTLVERATVVLLVRVEERLSLLAPTPLMVGAELVAHIEALGVALATMRGIPYKLKIRDAVRPQ